MGLSPATAEALARSCRKSPSASPLLNDSPKPAFLQGSAGAASRFRLGPGLHEEGRLLAGVSRKAVRELYTHVRDEALRPGNGEYLPHRKENPATYQQMHYVWRLHQHGQLHAADYALLAHQPHIIGSDMFGAVEEVGRAATAPPIERRRLAVDFQADRS